MFPGLTGKSMYQNPTPNFKGINKGDQTPVGSMATENLGGDSLTQFMRSLQNYLTTQGQSTFEQGKGITGSAIPGFGVAGDTTGTALDTSRQALATLNPAQDYWSKLLSGDQATMNKAIAPVAMQAGTNYANARTAAEQNTPRGGYANVLSAGLPQAQAREVNTALYQLQPTAATNLNAIAQTQGQVGGLQNQIASNQGQIAQWLASLGIDVSKLGAGLLSEGDQSLLARRGQNVQEHGQAMGLAGQLGGGLTSGVGGGIGRNIAAKTF